MISVVMHPLPPAINSQHTMYRVTMNGAILVNSSRQPGYDAARALLKAGFSGPFQTLDEKTGKVRMTFASIEKAARLAVEESETRFRVKRFIPYPGRTQTHRTADEGSGGTETPPDQDGLPE